jgi:hypothetical protein
LTRILRLEFALAALLLAPLIGYAIAYLMTDDAGRLTRVSPVAPAEGMSRSVPPMFEPLQPGRRVSVQAVPAWERRT